MTRLVRPPIVEVMRHRGPRPVAPPSTPLPPAVVTALATTVRDMRDVPRDCLVDRAELVHWLRRMAGRVEGVGRMTVPGRVSEIPTTSPRRPEGMVRTTTPSSQKAAIVAESGTLPARNLHSEDTSRLSGRALAAAVFGANAPDTSISRIFPRGPHAVSTPAPAKCTHILRTPSHRTITSRKGRAVQVETRRASSLSQLELGL